MSAPAPGAVGGSGTPVTASGSRLPLYRNPIRLVFSASPWRSAWYLIAYLFVGAALATVALAVAGIAGIFAVTLAGLPLLTAAAVALRGCANVERTRLRQVYTEPVRGTYRKITRPGVIAQATGRWKDPATWRDLAYLLGLWAPLATLNTVVLTLWGVSLAEITVPIWYRFPWMTYHGTKYHGVQLCCYFPNGPYGHGAVGIFIGSLPVALAVAGVSLVAFLILNYVLVATARAHAQVARALLGTPSDPLAEAKDILVRPGPLPPLIPNGR